MQRTSLSTRCAGLCPPSLIFCTWILSKPRQLDTGRRSPPASRVGRLLPCGRGEQGFLCPSATRVSEYSSPSSPSSSTWLSRRSRPLISGRLCNGPVLSSRGRIWSGSAPQLRRWTGCCRAWARRWSQGLRTTRSIPPMSLRSCATQRKSHRELLMLSRSVRRSQSSSSSVSSSEEPVPEGESALPNYLGLAQIAWFAMNRASVVHIIQEVEDGRLIPWCRSSSFSGGVAEQGLDPTSQPLPVCSGCQKRLPTDMRLAIEEGLVDKPPTTPSEDNVLE